MSNSNCCCCCCCWSPSERRRRCTTGYQQSARFGKWDRRWLRSPNGPVLGFTDAAWRLARRFSKALIQLLLSLSSPSSGDSPLLVCPLQPPPGQTGRCCNYYSMSQKQCTWLLIITSVSVGLEDRFPKFFNHQIPEEILYTLSRLSTSPKICINTTLWNIYTIDADNPISMAYGMWDLRIRVARYEALLVAQVWVIRL